MVLPEYSQSWPSSKAQVTGKLEMEVVCQFSDSPKQKRLFFFSFRCFDSLSLIVLGPSCLSCVFRFTKTWFKISLKRTANYKPSLYVLYPSQLTYYPIPPNSTPWWSAWSFFTISLSFSSNVLIHSFTHSFIHSFNNFLLVTYEASGTVDTGDTNMIRYIPALKEPQFS